MRHIRNLPASLLALLCIITPSVALRQRDGVQISTLKAADCGRPSQQGDKIKVDYRGRLQTTDVEFDNSYDRGMPFEFTLGAGNVIKGWDIALLDMCPGEERELVIPPELAYGHRGMPGIPADSTLIFDTALREIVGVEQPHEQSSAQTPSATAAASIASPSASPSATPTPTAHAIAEEEKVEDPPHEPEEGPIMGDEPKKRCQLLGPFALLVQGALGGFAILTLVWKRYREKPQRPWKIWFFDVSKQIFGSMLTHVLNVGMSMLSSVRIVDHAEKFGSAVQAQDKDGHYPNPCSFYLLNLAIDVSTRNALLKFKANRVRRLHLAYQCCGSCL